MLAYVKLHYAINSNLTLWPTARQASKGTQRQPTVNILLWHARREASPTREGPFKLGTYNNNPHLAKTGCRQPVEGSCQVQ